MSHVYFTAGEHWPSISLRAYFQPHNDAHKWSKNWTQVSQIPVPFTPQDQSYSQVLSLHILYSSKFSWHAKAFAEFHCVILHNLPDVYLMIPDMLQRSLLSCVVTVVVHQQWDHLPHLFSPFYVCLLHDPRLIFSKSNLEHTSFESHAVSAFL